MELYQLDGLFRRAEIIENFESYVWAERYTGIGDLEIVAPSTAQNKNLFAVGNNLGHSDSYRVMRVDTMVDQEDEQGNKKIKVTCSEIVDFLQNRITETGLLGTQPDTWTYTGTAGNTMRALFNLSSGIDAFTTANRLPYLTSTQPPEFPIGNLPSPSTSQITFERPNGVLFDAIHEIATVYDLGYRLVRVADRGALYFQVYIGSDRTSGQSSLPAVIFSSDMETLESVSHLRSISGIKNVAEVSSPIGNRRVMAPSSEGTPTGLNRRVLFVDASGVAYPPRNIQLTEAQENAAIKLKGLATTTLTAMDGLDHLMRKQRFEFGEVGAVLTAINAAGSNLTTNERNLLIAMRSQSAGLEAGETAWRNAELERIGQEELMKYRRMETIDGEVNQLSPYKYQRDYFLGDMVELRTRDGLINKMLVTEQIFIVDEQGEREYPTLTERKFITPGSWLDWDYNSVWADATQTWALA